MLRLGLRTKFFLYSNTVIVITASLVVTLWVVHARRATYEAVVRRARTISDALAVGVTDTLRLADTHDLPVRTHIHRSITQLLARNSDLLKYVIVCDPAGRILDATRPDLCDQIFPRVPPRGTGGPGLHRALITDTDGRQVLEFTTSLGEEGRPAGFLAAGFSLHPIEVTMEVIGKRALVVAILLILGNSIVTAIYVESLIRPILALNATMKRAGKGDLTVRADERRGDEVGELARAFNRMMGELEQAQEAARVHAAQLAHTEKMAAVGTLAAGVAHEINNPLAGIMNCVETLSADPGDPETYARYLGMIRDGLKRIERIVHNLLDFSRPREPMPELTSLNHSVHHVVELVQYQLNEGGIELYLELDPTGAMVLADHFQMEQLLLNLVLNAIAAMPRGGVLTLATRTTRGAVTLEVTDTGMGIPEDIRPRIFDPFFTTHQMGEGTGLGLAVSHRIVQAHRGRIEVESQVGKGTTMRVVIPHQAEPALREDDDADSV